jgi:hypothetical protein
LLDRDALVAEFYNLAFENKGNTNGFITAIENSKVEEVYQFNQYMEKMHRREDDVLEFYGSCYGEHPNYKPLLRVW